MYSCYFCKKCYENNRDTAFVRGHENPIGTYNCKFDGCEYVVEAITYDEYLVLWNATHSNDLILAMNDLKEKDIIEFQLKLSEFRRQNVERREAAKAIPKCPTCGSTNIQRVSASSKAGSVFLFGLMSQKVKHQWHCNNCKYEW